MDGWYTPLGSGDGVYSILMHQQQHVSLQRVIETTYRDKLQPAVDIQRGTPHDLQGAAIWGINNCLGFDDNRSLIFLP